MLDSPQSFIVREECDKAAWQNGFRRVLGEQGGWATFGSTTARGAIHLAAAGKKGPWFLALDHSGVIAEMGLPKADMPGPGLARHVFTRLGELYAALRRVYELGVSLPDAPLKEFEEKTGSLPKTTEAERLIVQRIGQDIFRASLEDYWGGCCPITGITDRALLRASHTKSWADCATDDERLDVYNGFLLAAHIDAAFDAALLTIDTDGAILLSPKLSEKARTLLTDGADHVRIADAHQAYLEHHRSRFRQ